MIKIIKRNFRLIILFARSMFQVILTYRLGVLTWVINGAVSPLFLMAIWLVVGQFGSLPASSKEIITYYLLSIFVVRATQTWTIDDIGDEIVRGDFSSKLLKPFNYLAEDFGRSWGGRLVRFMIIVPIFFIISVIFSNFLELHFQPLNIIFFLAALLLGQAVRFYLENLLVMFVFWTNDVHSINMCDELLRDFFGGSFIPIFLAPEILKNIMIFLPYRYYISFPLEIIIGRLSIIQILQTFSLGILFVLILAYLHKIVFSMAVKKNSAFGS